ncbi:hypothetical protein ACROYT_G000769 [Oculina patagonica]
MFDMNSTGEAIQAISISLVVANFLLNTCRVPKAIEIYKECLGALFKHLGEYNKAKEYLERAIAITQEIGDRRIEASSYSTLGAVLHSLEYLEKALAIRKEIGDRDGEAIDYENVGNLFQSLGKYAKAVENLEKALAIRRELGNRQGEASCYGSLGTLFFSIGDYDKAIEYHQAAIVIRTQLGHRDGVAKDYGNLGDVLALLRCYEGNIEEAYTNLLSSIQKCEELREYLGDIDKFKINFTDEHVFPYKMLCEMLCAAGQPHEAVNVLELGRARALADLMSAQYSVKNQITPDPHSWVGLERIDKERNCTFYTFLILRKT